MIKINAIGSDPEFGVYDNEKEEFVSVVGLLGGTKNKPLDIGKGCARQEDNVMAEFTIPPARSRKEFLNSIRYCIKKGNEILQNNNPNLSIKALSSCIYSEEALKHPKSKEFGCSVSFNAYDQDVTPCPESKNPNLRSAGFHVHISYKGSCDDTKTIENLIKVLDLHLGLPSVLIDLDTQRRELYGKAGEFRFRQIDDLVVVEYRSIGGNLLGDNKLINFMYDNSVAAVDYLNKNSLDHMISKEKEIRKAIDNSVKDLALELLKEFNINYPKIQILEENIVINE